MRSVSFFGSPTNPLPWSIVSPSPPWHAFPRSECDRHAPAAFLAKIQSEGEESSMNTITTSDGTQIYFKDWGSGQPIVFSHGWPLSADDCSGHPNALFFLEQGYRVIAHDRRGHGRSTQTDGDVMTWIITADDLAALTARPRSSKTPCISATPLAEARWSRYLARHGESRAAKAVLISSVPPLMSQDGGQPRRVCPRRCLTIFRPSLHDRPGAVLL